MENARGTALFLVVIFLLLYYVVFHNTLPPPKDADEAVQRQGTNFKGPNLGVKHFMPPLSIPISNCSANGYAGITPTIT